MEYILLGSCYYTAYSTYDYHQKLNSLQENGKYKNFELETIEDDLEGISFYHVPSKNKTIFNEDFIFNKLNSKKNDKTYYSNLILDKEVDSFYIHNHIELAYVANKYNFDTQRFYYKLPMIACQYKLNKNIYRIGFDKTGFIGTNKEAVIKKFAYYTRLPFSFTFASLTLLSFTFIALKQ